MSSPATNLADDRPIGSNHDTLIDWAIDAEAMLRAQQLVINRLSRGIRLVTVDIDQSRCDRCIFNTDISCIATVDLVDACYAHHGEWRTE